RLHQAAQGLVPGLERVTQRPPAGGGVTAGVAIAARALVLALLSGVATDARGASEASFQLSAGLEDLRDYFPGYLANGYVSTLTAPRGTEATRAYMVALMDYTPGDMSRPAAVPGWTEVDFSAGPRGGPHGWLNRAPLSAEHFKDYRQTLDLRGATLTTSYRYVDQGRETSIEVITLVSEASPHLAATHLKITPDYDGPVRLSFALLPWANHAPRFPLAEMSGPQMEEAVAANGLALEPRPPATSDREAVWYPGHTQVLASDGDAPSRALWLDGKAEQGLAMAMAAAVELLEGDAQAQQVVHSELYYLLASSTPDTAWPVGACGLTPGYASHVFWDSDTWIFPALLLLHPQRAKSLVAFRERTVDAARQRARQRGFEGAMYPWESDPENGTEQTPHAAYVLGESEIHVNADVAIAQWQYYLATHDRDWLRAHGSPVIREVARFWASRTTYDAPARRYQIMHVNSVAESNTDIPNDTFTNVSAAKALEIAVVAARVLGEQPDR